MEHWHIGHDDPQSIITYLDALRSSLRCPLIVCFDYFDTVVVRNVEPEHTKKLASSLLSILLKGHVSGPKLYRYRQKLELELTNQNGERYGELDFSLDDFAARFWAVLQEKEIGLKQCHGLRHPESFVQTLLNIEVAVEKAVQTPCPQVLHVLHALREKGFPLFLLSDFYLPEPFFLEMMRGVGLDTFFRRIYVSSSHGKGKGSGQLYKKIFDEIRCTPDQVIMVGDNPHADIAMARQAGVKTIQVYRQHQEHFYSTFRRTRKKRIERPEAVLEAVPMADVPFREMGGSLWLFIHRLFTALQEQGVTTVFFLSKEGEFLQRLFEFYQKNLFNHVLISSHYLLASRKATFLASLKALEQEDFHRLFDHYRDISLREFLQSLNFDASIITSLCGSVPIDCDERIPDLQRHPEFANLIGNKLFADTYEKQRTQQAANFRRYLESFGVDYHVESLHLVDVGWKGSIQDNIFFILGGQVTIHGYYIGSLNATERSEKNRKTGLLFDNYPAPSPYFHVFNNNRSLYEMMLGASHGSADCYLTEKQLADKRRTEALVIHETLNTEEDRLHIMVQDLPEERELYLHTIKPLQECYFDSFRDLISRYLRAGCRIADVDWFAQHHARMVFLPEPEEIDFFQKLYHFENFGIFEFTTFDTSQKFSLFERARNLKNIVRNPGVLESGIWPPIVLRHFGVGFWQCVDGRRRFFRTFGRLHQRSLERSVPGNGNAG
jgi:FMN phosphatase YigB (HAD superfamily)